MAKQDGPVFAIHQTLHSFQLGAQVLGLIHVPAPRRLVTVRWSVGYVVIIQSCPHRSKALGPRGA